MCYNLFSSCGCRKGLVDGFSVGGQCNDKSKCDYSLIELCENAKNTNNQECLTCISKNQHYLKSDARCNQTDFNNFCIREDYSDKYKGNDFSEVDFTECSEDNINDIAFIFNNDIKTRKNFENASFVNSYIMYVDFSGLNLQNASFTDADISYSNFKNANLKNSNLKDARVSMENLCNGSTILDGTGYHCSQNGYLYES